MISSVFIRRPRLSVVISVVITLGGLLSLSRIPVAQLPELVPPQVQVSAVYPGASAEVLESMDRFAESIDAACTTMVCAVVDLKRKVLTYASAGHLPMLHVRGDESTWLDGVGGPPLTVATRPRVNTKTEIRVDDLLVLYSDGLVERRGENIDEGLARLRAATLERRGEPVQRLIDGILDDLIKDDARDDVVVVVKRVPLQH